MLKQLILLIAVTSGVYGCTQTIICFDNLVNEKINKLIGAELIGQFTYLHLSQMFERHTTYYPNVAKFFREESARKLERAERVIQYQNQRGGTVKFELIERYNLGACNDVQSLLVSLKCAMEYEGFLTSQLTQFYQEVSNAKIFDQRDCEGTAVAAEDDLRLTQPMLVTCRLRGGGNESVRTSQYSLCECSSITGIEYVELAQMISHEFLSQQVKNTKELASFYHSVLRIHRDNDWLGDYLFDRHLKTHTELK